MQREQQVQRTKVGVCQVYLENSREASVAGTEEASGNWLEMKSQKKWGWSIQGLLLNVRGSHRQP